MKRILSTIFAALAVMMASSQASAQFFDHLSLGVGAGFDGISLDLGVPVGDFMQLRAGGSYLPPYGYRKEFPNFEYQDGESIDLNILAQPQISAFNAMLDLFPGRKTGFHFTLGLLAGDRTIASVRTEGLDVDEKLVLGDTQFEYDDNGQVRVNLDVNKFLPYVGIGAGRAVRSKPVTFVFDFGVLYTGGLGLYTTASDLSRPLDGIQYVRITSEDLAEVDFDDYGILDKVGEFPVLPMLKFSLFFRIF